jgi:hypothetical protein
LKKAKESKKEEKRKTISILISFNFNFFFSLKNLAKTTRAATPAYLPKPVGLVIGIPKILALAAAKLSKGLPKLKLRTS